MPYAPAILGFEEQYVGCENSWALESSNSVRWPFAWNVLHSCQSNSDGLCGTRAHFSHVERGNEDKIRG